MVRSTRTLAAALALVCIFVAEPTASQWTSATTRPVNMVSKPMHKLKNRVRANPRAASVRPFGNALNAEQTRTLPLPVEPETTETTEQAPGLGFGLFMFSALSAALVWGRNLITPTGTSEGKDLKLPLLAKNNTTQAKIASIGDISAEGILVSLNSQASSSAEHTRISLKYVLQNGQLASVKTGERIGLKDFFRGKRIGALKAAELNAAAMLKNLKAAKPVALTAFSNLVLTFPAHAEAGKLFDFDLTLPIIAVEFLTLMVILDKTVFGPVGKTLDDRDELIRSQLQMSGSNADAVNALLEEKEQLIKEARSEVGKQVSEAKAEIDSKIAAESLKAKAGVDKQIAEAIKALDVAKADSEKVVDAKGQELADEIISKVVNV